MVMCSCCRCGNSDSLMGWKKFVWLFFYVGNFGNAKIVSNKL